MIKKRKGTSEQTEDDDIHGIIVQTISFGHRPNHESLNNGTLGHLMQ